MPQRRGHANPARPVLSASIGSRREARSEARSAALRGSAPASPEFPSPLAALASRTLRISYRSLGARVALGALAVGLLLASSGPKRARDSDQSSVKIDGKLDDAAWRAAPATTASPRRCPTGGDGADRADDRARPLRRRRDLRRHRLPADQAPIVARLTRRDRHVEADASRSTSARAATARAPSSSTSTPRASLSDAIRFNDTDSTPTGTRTGRPTSRGRRTAGRRSSGSRSASSASIALAGAVVGASRCGATSRTGRRPTSGRTSRATPPARCRTTAGSTASSASSRRAPLELRARSSSRRLAPRSLRRDPRRPSPTTDRRGWPSGRRPGSI